MKIVMLGHNGVGKSTYMASVYGAMQERPFDLRLKVKGSGEHKRLLDEASKLRGGIYLAAPEV